MEGRLSASDLALDGAAESEEEEESSAPAYYLASDAPPADLCESRDVERRMRSSCRTVWHAR